MNHNESKILDDTNPPESNPLSLPRAGSLAGHESTNSDPTLGQINEDKEIARIPPRFSIEELRRKPDAQDTAVSISIDELRTNQTLARHVLLQLWREGLLDKDFRSVVMRDIGTLVSVYGSVEPMYSTEAGARFLCVKREHFRQYLTRFAADIKPPFYVNRRVKQRGFRQKVRLVYASDIETIRRKTQIKGKYRNGKYTGSVRGGRNTPRIEA